MAGITKNISEKEIKKIAHAQDIAFEYITIAIQALKTLELSGELSPHAIKTTKSLEKHFGKVNQYIIKSVFKTLHRIQRVLNDDGAKYNFQAAKIGNKMGRAIFLGKTVKLGAPFFETNVRNRVVTIIHETGHIIGLNFLIPELYEGKSKNMPTIYRLYNADDVALFVYEIGQSKEFKQV